MRVLAALLVLVLVSPRALAHPVRDFDFEGDFVRHKKGRPYKPPPPPCPSTGNWTKLTRCQLKTLKIEMLKDQPTLKLIAYEPPGYGRPTKRLELYVLVKGVWTKLGFYAETNATTELLRFEALAGEVYRLDMGYATPTWVTLDEVNTRPAMLMRRYTYYCTLTYGCPAVMSTCDVLVRGKAVSTFRGVPSWTGSKIEIRGDGRGTNRYCAKPPNLIEDEGQE